MTKWLLDGERWEWLLAMVFVSICTSTAIGLRQGSKGGAIFVSNLTAALSALALYPFVEKWGFSGPFVLPLALVCGACGLAMFGVLISLSDIITRRRERLAGNLLDRVLPGSDEKPP